jgi:hypothetical protein
LVVTLELVATDVDECEEEPQATSTRAQAGAPSAAASLAHARLSGRPLIRPTVAKDRYCSLI